MIWLIKQVLIKSIICIRTRISRKLRGHKSTNSYANHYFWVTPNNFDAFFAKIFQFLPNCSRKMIYFRPAGNFDLGTNRNSFFQNKPTFSNSPIFLKNAFFPQMSFFLNADKVFSICSCPKGVLSHHRFWKWSFSSKNLDQNSILDRNLGF